MSGRQRFLLSFVWLNSEVSWSTAGKGNAPGGCAFPFLLTRSVVVCCEPLSRFRVWCSRSNVCKADLWSRLRRVTLALLDLKIQYGIMKQWKSCNLLLHVCICSPFPFPLFQEYGQQPKSQEGELKISAVFSVSGSPLGKK